MGTAELQQDALFRSVSAPVSSSKWTLFKSLPVAKPGELYSLGDSHNGGDTVRF